jgi:ElaB/YqjD/DUF883 family membrane-anchored ribosome-binding protein
MSDAPEPVEGPIQEQADAIVTAGQEVRVRIGRLVTETAEKFHLNKDGLLGIARSIVDGAGRAVDRAVPRDPDSVLRPVVDGLGDGLSAAALACRLAFEEARAQGKSFASEDLTRLQQDLKNVKDRFVETVSTTARRGGSLASSQLGSLRKHAETTMARMMPAIESALTAARDHPLRLVGESAGAGLTLSRQVLGALFTSVGRRLQDAGQRLRGGGETP